MIELWKRLPLIVRTVVAGVFVTGAGTLPWALLTAANVRMLPSLPWGTAVMVVYLWLMARWLNGAGWPSELSEARRRAFRFKKPEGSLWRWSLIAGGLSVLSFRALTDVIRRLSPRPQQDLIPPEMLAQFPFVTVLLLFLTTAAVAGFVEEAGYRGMMQAPLERRYGPAVAIAIVGFFFALAHYRFGVADIWPWLLFTPLYLLASVVWGLLAYWSKSTLPGMIWHALFDAAGMLRYWWAGIPASIWEGGMDRIFKIECALAVLFAIPACWALRRVAQESRRARVEGERGVDLFQQTGRA